MALRTVTWASVYNEAVRMCGLAVAQATNDDRAAFKDWINSAARLAWEHFWWPELMRAQQRAFRPAWTATNYAAGDEVYYAAGNAYYRANDAATSADEPGTSAKWDAINDELDAYIALEQDGEDAIGEVKRVTRENPRIHRNPGELPFTLNENGVQLDGEVPARPWVEFRIPPENFSGDDHDAAATYAVDDQFYSDAEGDFFRVTTAGTVPDPTDAAKCTRLLFPKILAEYAARRAWSEWLASEGQGDKSAIEENRALTHLDREVDKIVGQQGQAGRYRVRV